MSGLDALAGGRVQRVDGPHPELVAITLHRASLHGALLLATGPRHIDWGWVPERPRGDPASTFVLLLRKHLLGARLRALEVQDTGARAVFSRGESEVSLTLVAEGPNLFLDVDGVRAGARRREGSDPGASLPAGFPRDAVALQDRGPAIQERLRDAGRDAELRAARKSVSRRLKQLRRRLKAIEGDLARLDEVPELRDTAGLILSNLGAISPDAAEASVTDWTRDPPAPRTIVFGPGRSAKEEAEARFRRARKLERGAEVALGRYELTEQEVEALEALQAELEDASEAQLEALMARATKLGARAARGSSARSQHARLPYHEFVGAFGRPIRVGRSAADNDALTLRHARPWDLWLHARGVPGSHVVVPLEKGESCPQELLVDAAHLAARYSERSGEVRVEVSYLERRYVRKPRGAAPGSVSLAREKTLLVRIEADRIERLVRSRQPV